MNTNNKIVLKEIAVYHPQKTITNDFFIQHFEKQGNNITRLLEATGRESRYVGEENETSLTMGIESTLQVLAKANLTGVDIDMIVFVSASPEYLAPPNAVSIHKAIDGKLDTLTFDECWVRWHGNGS